LFNPDNRSLSLATATRNRRKIKPERRARVLCLGNRLILWLTVARNTTAYRMTPLPSDFARRFSTLMSHSGLLLAPELPGLLLPDATHLFVVPPLGLPERQHDGRGREQQDGQPQRPVAGEEPEGAGKVHRHVASPRCLGVGE
jgi:hypothetical protein